MRAHLAVDSMSTPALWKELRTRWYQIDALLSQGHASREVQRIWEGVGPIARELELRGTQGTLFDPTPSARRPR